MKFIFHRDGQTSIRLGAERSLYAIQASFATQSGGELTITRRATAFSRINGGKNWDSTSV